MSPHNRGIGVVPNPDVESMLAAPGVLLLLFTFNSLPVVCPMRLGRSLQRRAPPAGGGRLSVAGGPGLRLNHEYSWLKTLCQDLCCCWALPKNSKTCHLVTTHGVRCLIWQSCRRLFVLVGDLVTSSEQTWICPRVLVRRLQCNLFHMVARSVD